MRGGGLTEVRAERTVLLEELDDVLARPRVDDVALGEQDDAVKELKDVAARLVDAAHDRLRVLLCELLEQRHHGQSAGRVQA